MPVKQAKGTLCPDPLIVDSATIQWFEKRYPNIDYEIAAERYSAWSIAGGYLYCNHMKALQNYVNREADNNKLGPMLKKPKTKEETLRDEGRRCGFREPISGETYSQYEQALRAHQQSRSNVVVSMLKK